MPWQTIASEAERESPLWGEALRAEAEPEAVFSTLADDRYTLGLETIYEGYLVHYGTARLFAAEDPDVALLLGDGAPGDGEAWAETAERLGGGIADRSAREGALSAHARLVG